MARPKRYRQHEKLRTVCLQTQFVHDFLTFCEEHGVYQMKDGVYMRHDDLLYRFVGVDRWKLEDEKRAMIEDGKKGLKRSS